MQKVGRNDPCPCGSGKKFKKCCENKMIGKRFMATKIDTSSLQGKVNKAFNVTSVFNPSAAPVEKKEEPAKQEQKVEASETNEPKAPKAKRTYTHKEKKKD